jgi:hypothetical protein
MNESAGAHRLPEACEVETLPWARVQAMGDGVQLMLGVARQVGPLGRY